MTRTRGWLCLGLLCLGCQSLVSLEPGDPVEGAELLWDKGQDAMRRGQPEEAIVFYQQSLAVNPLLVRSHLSLAAALLQQGDEAAACPHLMRYVRAHPGELLIRIHLADLLFRLERWGEAREELEQCVAGAQEKGEAAAGQLLHCHAQLMEVAEARRDDYAEHLNRGIGLFLLAGQRAVLPDPEGELSTEELLCKAAGELTLAHLSHPGEARPSWYLHEIWSCLAEHQPALRFLRNAEASAPFTYLTPAEKRSLQLACQCEKLQRPIK